MLFRKNKTLTEKASDYLGAVADSVKPTLEDAFDKAVAASETAREKAGPALADARAHAAPIIAQGKATAAEKAAVLGAVAAEKASEGRELAVTKLAEIKGEEPEPKGGKFKKLLLITGLLAVGGFIFKKLRSNDSDNWQTSYVPQPPAPAPKPAAPAASGASSTEDVGGGAPGEALSDAADAPHDSSTPDAPADVVDVEDVPKN